MLGCTNVGSHKCQVVQMLGLRNVKSQNGWGTQMLSCTNVRSYKCWVAQTFGRTNVGSRKVKSQNGWVTQMLSCTNVRSYKCWVAQMLFRTNVGSHKQHCTNIHIMTFNIAIKMAACYKMLFQASSLKHYADYCYAECLLC